MPIISPSKYHPSWLFRNQHINTLYPYLLRKKKNIPFYRERLWTPDNDFFDVDWWKQADSKKLIILLHGLEGSSLSQYINGMSQIMYQNAYNVSAINFRSCSGEMNHQLAMYHSGFTKDLHFFIESKTRDYDHICICGFSLGGNVTLKYISDRQYNISPKIKTVAGVSVPCDLRSGSIKLKKWYNYLYEQKFLATLLQKVKIKHKMMPDKIDISRMHTIKSLWDFDDIYTAGFHGFADAEDYYSQCSSLQFLPNITIPTLLINAHDDTFLADDSYPYEIAKNHAYLHLITPKYGGHVGFADYRNHFYWSELKVLEFFKTFE